MLTPCSRPVNSSHLSASLCLNDACDSYLEVLNKALAARRVLVDEASCTLSVNEAFVSALLCNAFRYRRLLVNRGVKD
jgi:hypothetical protein